MTKFRFQYSQCDEWHESEPSIDFELLTVRNRPVADVPNHVHLHLRQLAT